MLELQALSRLIYTEPPESYLGHKSGKSPVILVPGLYERWGVFKTMADVVSDYGHDVYTIPSLGDNRLSIDRAVKKIIKHNEDNHLEDVAKVYFGHSKAGPEIYEVLKKQPEAKAIVFCGSFSGSIIAYLGFLRSIRELTPKNIAKLNSGKDSSVYERIVSVFSKFDYLIPNGSLLDGAKNLHSPLYGHLNILEDTEVITLAVTQLSRWEDEKKEGNK